MSNFFTDNPDLMFALDNVDLADVVALREENYTQAEQFDFAPENYEDAKDSYKRVLEVIGEVTGERIAPRARQVDEEGPSFENGKVTVADGRFRLAEPCLNFHFAFWHPLHA